MNKYNIGDEVIFINDFGIDFGKRRITSVDKVSYSGSGYGYKITPTDTPWFAIKEENLFTA